MGSDAVFVEMVIGLGWRGGMGAIARVGRSGRIVTIAFAIYFPKVVLWLPKQFLPESVGCFKSPTGAGYICPP